MPGINAQSIKKLRDLTDASMSDCKTALVEAEGEIEKAVEILLKKGLAQSAKKADAVSEGEVRACTSADKRSATIIEVNIQTDFAARNETFKQFVGDVLTAAAQAPEGCDLNRQPLNGQTVGDVATELAGRIGEKVVVRRWGRVAIPVGEHGLTQEYVHLSGKVGCILAIKTSTAAVAAHPDVVKFANETTLQIAVMSPLALRREEISEEQKARQKEIYRTQLREDPRPKPEAAWPKIIEGKLQKWFSEVTILEQESLATPGLTVAQGCEAAAKAAGGSVKIMGFVRFERGEGVVVSE